jgi:exportin-1
MGNAARSLDYLRNPEIAKSLTNILKTNTRAATSLGHCCKIVISSHIEKEDKSLTFFADIVQLGRLFMDMLNVYKVYSDSISQVVATGGPHATAMSNVRAMRSVKKEVHKKETTSSSVCEYLLLLAGFEASGDVHCALRGPRGGIHQLHSAAASARPGRL